uniref:Uncharacterized protein n=1 Tax=Acrobeloides nanus TaxID=290746 RepID=A0A914CZA5_9BILA
MYPDDEPIKVSIPENAEPPPEYENSKNYHLLSACISKNVARKRCAKYATVIISFVLGFIFCFVFTAIFNTVIDSHFIQCERQINDDPDFYLRLQEEKIKELQQALEEAIKDKQILQGKLNTCNNNFNMTKTIFEEKFFKTARPDWVRNLEIRMRKAQETMEKEQGREIRRAIEVEKRKFRNRIKDYIRSQQQNMDLQNNLIKKINEALQDSYKNPNHIDQNKRRFCDMFNTLVDHHMLFRTVVYWNTNNDYDYEYGYYK